MSGGAETKERDREFPQTWGEVAIFCLVLSTGCLNSMENEFSQRQDFLVSIVVMSFEYISS